MIRRPPRSTQSRSSAASDVYKRQHIVDALITERKENGAYEDIFDLLERVTDKDLNKKSLESLIKSGAMEGFGERGLLLANLERFLSFNKEETQNKDSRQESLFGDLPGAIKTRPTLTDSPPVCLLYTSPSPR